jgi:hypothetical protein
MTEYIPNPSSRKQAIELGLPYYFTGKSCKKGHVSKRQALSGSCVECQRIYDKSELRRQIRPRDPQHLREWSKAHYATNRDRLNKAWGLYYAGNREELGKKNGVYRKRRYASDLEFRIKVNLRNRLGGAFRGQKLEKSGRTFDLTGCTFKELIEHLEGQFQPGMTLDNYGEWQIDHIIPCASFDLRCPLQQKLCFGFWNLQPLWVEDHKAKSVKDVALLGGVNG